MPPPIRYPLPTLVLLVLVAVSARYGTTLLRPIAARWHRVLVPPPPAIPASATPKIVTGPIIRKALLLHDETRATEVPDGPTVETIRVRMFVAVYDVWPLSGPPTHYRVGNRRPIGWVRAEELLPWDTRLVVHAPDGVLPISELPGGATHPTRVGTLALPVVAWSVDAVKVAVWEPDAPWRRVTRTGWVGLDTLRPARWGAWVSREELLALLRLSLTRGGATDGELLRLRCVLGRLTDAKPLTEEESVLARSALPPVVFKRATTPADVAESESERLARLNERWEPEAEWAGVSFSFVPLSALP